MSADRTPISKPAPVLLGDIEAARFLIRSCDELSPPTLAERASLSPEWGEGCLLAAGGGKAAVSRWLKTIVARDKATADRYKAAIEAGRASPIPAVIKLPAPVRPTPDGEPEYESLSDEDMGIISAESLDPEPIEWLWPGRIAEGKINLLAGEGGDGKSQVAMRIAAAVTTGGMFPDGTGPAKLGSVVILAAEDGLRDTIIPRLIAAGADRRKVKIVTARVVTRSKDGKALIDFKSFQHLPYWRDIARRAKDVRLLIADPIPAFLGRGVNDHRNSEVRTVLEPFADLLDELRIALLGITHLGKSTDQKTPVHKILGSVAYVNLARTAHITARDADDKERRLLCQVKNNVGKVLPALAYRIAEAEVRNADTIIRTARVDFEDKPIEADLAALLNPQRPSRSSGDSTKTAKVAEWLFDFLATQGSWTAFGAITDAAGSANLIGKRQSDGKWSNIRPLYMAKDHLPQLGGDRTGREVLEGKFPIGSGNREYVHWRLSED